MLLALNSSFAQDFHLENRVFDCLIGTLDDMGVDFKKGLSELEDQCIKNGILADKSGESYYLSFSNLNRMEEYNFRLQSSVFDSLKSANIKIDDERFVKCKELCKTFQNSSSYKYSKIFLLNTMVDSLKKSGNFDLEDISSSTLKILEPDDFENEFYKMTTLFILTAAVNSNKESEIKLPPWSEDKLPLNIESRNLLIVHVSENNDTCTLNGRKIYIDSLVTIIIKYIKSDPNDIAMPELKPVIIDLIGECYQSQLVISLSNERSTRYDTYIKAFELLKTAYSKARDEKSIDYFGLKFDKLSQQQQDAISLLIPMCLIEKETTR